MLDGEKKKVMIVAASLDVGGAEKDIVRNIPRIDRNTYDISVTLFRARGSLAIKLEDENIRVNCFANNQVVLSEADEKINFFVKFFEKLKIHLLKVTRSFKEFLYIRSQIKIHKPDIIHCFSPHAQIYVSLACLTSFTKAKCIVSCLSLQFYSKSSPLLALMEKYLGHPLMDFFVANSKAVIQRLKSEKVPEDKIVLIYNGLDPKDYQIERTPKHFNAADPFIITAVANLHAYKGYDDLLQAMCIVKKQLPALRWKLLIAGKDTEGNLKKYLDFLRMHKLSTHVSFLGLSDDIPGLLVKGHLHIHPSHTEGLPNSIIEAMCAGLPVIATHVGGIPEIVDDTDTGLLVPAQDIDALVKAIISLLGDSGKLYTMGQAGQRKVKTMFGLLESVKKYEMLYNTVLER